MAAVWLLSGPRLPRPRGAFLRDAMRIFATANLRSERLVHVLTRRNNSCPSPRMLRLFYLLLFPAVIVAPYGCAGSTFWLGGDPGNEVRGDQAPVAVSDAATTTPSPPVKGAPERQTNAV